MSRENARPVPLIRRPPQPKALEQIAEKWEQFGAETVERPSVHEAPKRPSAEESLVASRKGIVERRGFPLANGERRGAKLLRKHTFYLPPDIAENLAVRSAKTGSTMSDIVSAALRDYLDQ